MDNIPAYIRRKHGQEPVTYLHPLLEPYLDKTYGIFVYQEDIMSAAIALGGFTGPEADTLGYAIRKKKSAVLRAQKEKFVTQAAERGVPAKTIDDVFAAFEPFERYGFNKAHATCYGLIAYQTAYLKANYTVEYMTAVLTAFRSNEEKVAAAVAECRRMDIEVLPPDVHSSQLEFTVEGEAIRFGLLAVKNVGASAIESIIAARDEGGPFTSLTDFCTRIDLRLCNRKVLEALAKVGALNAFGHPRQILDGLDDAVLAAQATQRDRISGQTSLFDLGAADAASLTRPLPATPEAPVRERLRWEKELLGLYLSEHPMGEVAAQVGQFVNAYSGDLNDESLEGQRIVVGGIVTGIRTVITKAKATMADRHDGGPPGHDRGGRVPAPVRDRPARSGATARSCWSPAASTTAARRSRSWPTSSPSGTTRSSRARRRSPRDVAAGDRGARRRGPGGNGWQNGSGARQRSAGQAPGRPMVAVGPGPGVGDDGLPGVPVAVVSPLRHDGLPPTERRRRLARGRSAPFAPAEPVPTYVDAPGMAAMAPDRDLDPAVPGRGPGPDRRRCDRRHAGRCRSGRGPARAVRGPRAVGSRRGRDGDVQGPAARPPRRDARRHPCPGAVGWRGPADGAPARRRLRLGAGRRGPPSPGRRARGTVARQRLTV